MTREQRQALRQAAEQATPGPWDYVMHGPQPTVFRPDGTVVCDLYRGCDLPDGQPEDNAHFISAANPAAILALLNALDEAEGAQEHAEEQLGRMYWHLTDGELSKPYTFDDVKSRIEDAITEHVRKAVNDERLETWRDVQR